MLTEQTVQILVLIFHLRLESHHRYVVERNTRIGLKHSQMLKSLLLYLGKIFWCIFIFARLHLKMKLAIGLIGLIKAICLGNVALYLFVYS